MSTHKDIRARFSAEMSKNTELTDQIVEGILPTEKKDKLLELVQRVAKKSKVEKFTELSKFTYENYKKELGDIATVFKTNTGAFVLKDWRKYVTEAGELAKSVGEKAESAIYGYAIQNGADQSTSDWGTGQIPGVDIVISGKEVEAKSKKNDAINLMLQTTFFANDPNKFYMFIANTDKKDLIIRTVSAEVLNFLTLGEKIHGEIAAGGESETLKQQVIDGLSNLNFEDRIIDSLLNRKQGKYENAFFIGDSGDIKVRFLIFIEPKGKF